MTHRVLALLALLAVAAAAAAVFTSPAGAATPTDKKVAALQKQVALMSRQITNLNKQVAALKKTDARLASLDDAVAALTFCSAALSADALSGTWAVIDQISAATQAGKTYFGVQPVVNDGQTCDAFKVTRSQVVPPTLAGYQAFLALLSAPSRALLAFAPYAR